MAVSSVQCPQCEMRVETHAAAPRLGPCPACGTALESDAEPVTGFAALPEEAFDRMRLDPGLAAVRRKLFLGVAAVAGLIVLAIVADHLRQGQPGGAPKTPRAAMAAEPARSIQHVQPVYAAASLEERLARANPDAAMPATTTIRKEEKLAAPVFELSDAAPALKPSEEGAPQVFEVSDLPTIVAPQP